MHGLRIPILLMAGFALSGCVNGMAGYPEQAVYEQPGYYGAPGYETPAYGAPGYGGPPVYIAPYAYGPEGHDPRWQEREHWREGDRHRDTGRPVASRGDGFRPGPPGGGPQAGGPGRVAASPPPAAQRPSPPPRPPARSNHEAVDQFGSRPSRGQ